MKLIRTLSQHQWKVVRWGGNGLVFILLILTIASAWGQIYQHIGGYYLTYPMNNFMPLNRMSIQCPLWVSRTNQTVHGTIPNEEALPIQIEAWLIYRNRTPGRDEIEGCSVDDTGQNFTCPLPHTSGIVVVHANADHPNGGIYSFGNSYMGYCVIHASPFDALLPYGLGIVLLVVIVLRVRLGRVYRALHPV